MLLERSDDPAHGGSGGAKLLPGTSKDVDGSLLWEKVQSRAAFGQCQHDDIVASQNEEAGQLKTMHGCLIL